MKVYPEDGAEVGVIARICGSMGETLKATVTAKSDLQSRAIEGNGLVVALWTHTYAHKR